MTMVMKTVSAGTFKAKCLSLMDQVQAQRTELVITKRGKPVAKLVPIEEEPRNIFGCMAGTAKILGDLLEPVVDPDDWEANR
jgi:prevent-host-death family protein